MLLSSWHTCEDKWIHTCEVLRTEQIISTMSVLASVCVAATPLLPCITDEDFLSGILTHGYLCLCCLTCLVLASRVYWALNMWLVWIKRCSEYKMPINRWTFRLNNRMKNMSVVKFYVDCLGQRHLSFVATQFCWVGGMVCFLGCALCM